MDAGGKVGGAALPDAFMDYAAQVRRRIRIKFLKWAHKLASDAQRHAPVETGQLKVSIHGDVEERGNEIIGVYGTNEEHAVFVEFGTNRIKVGTPDLPRRSWPAKEKTKTQTPETMPYIRHAWAKNRVALVKDLKDLADEINVGGRGKK